MDYVNELERIQSEFQALPAKSPDRKRLLNELETVIRRALIREPERATGYVKEAREIRFYPYFGTFEEHPESWPQGVEQMRALIKSVQFHVRTDTQSNEVIPSARPSNQIFIVHGRDHAMLRDVEAFVRRIGIDAVVLMDEPSRNATVIEKFERHADVPFAIILFSPDDVGRAANEPDKPLRRRPRQNAVLELGFFIGRLKRENTVVLVDGAFDEDVEYPSDFGGVIPIEYSSHSDWKTRLLRELRASGIQHDPTKA
jgi:predicted nucleotide-binding protein